MLFAKPSPRTRRAFTLIELLTVVIIIGILAGLVTAAAIRVRTSVRKAAVVLEIKQLEMAFHAYKDRFGEFPPDDLRESNWPAIRRHLAKAFPRYRPGAPSGSSSEGLWQGFQEDVEQFWGLEIGALTHGAAITFFLGGRPIWTGGSVPNGELIQRPVVRFDGFSANPANPFDNATSRIGPFYDFAPEQIMGRRFPGHPTQALHQLRLICWPKGIVNTNTGRGALAYFRAENGTYFLPGTTTPKRWDWDEPWLPDGTGWLFNNGHRLDPARPVFDSRHVVPAQPDEIPRMVWINPRSFQIFSSGMDMEYGPIYAPFPDPVANLRPLIPFPNGPYGEATLDDLANFTDGTMEDAMP